MRRGLQWRAWHSSRWRASCSYSGCRGSMDTVAAESTCRLPTSPRWPEPQSFTCAPPPVPSASGGSGDRDRPLGLACTVISSLLASCQRLLLALAGLLRRPAHSLLFDVPLAQLIWQ